ncbi:hypothetical protein RHGRI_032070 [Rhododendron griersonianum]|uniref:Enhancer of polycomb-like protein n=1 Tax=Rhododendron griersonianum TaxID=479676 RepID=A0AAV6IB32_9ERIC|nr:hypothetical protein RHGRI_032070 [Rhododendron griersonianum]KAG5525637.1 hypothetical protein RHGRI_032070 [Rhododendron griersonianum]
MSRLSFRPRPLDIHKKLPIVKSVKEFEDDETPTSTRNSQIMRLAAEADTEVQQVPTKKVASEIPTPEFVVVDTYERDYSRTFSQPTSYLRARGARAELGEFVEYDVDNEDEDWIQEFNEEKELLTPEIFETALFKLEILDHKARERAGIITPTLGSPVPVLLQFDAAAEALLPLSIEYGISQCIYDYWKEKRERWQKPILRRLQPPPPSNDTNPYNVFRPREKAHRLHTRRMQRRENNVQSFEKLRQVRRNLDQAKTLLEALIKREEKKREVTESEVSLQRIQMKYKHETELLEDSLGLPGFPSFPGKFGSSEEEFVDSDDVAYSRQNARQNTPFADTKLVMVSPGSIKREFRRRNAPNGWLQKLDPLEPVLLFTKPLVPEKLAAVGIVPPSSSPMTNIASVRSQSFHGRIGRGGRIVFDRWNPLMHTTIDCGDTFYIPPKPRPSMHN